MSASVARIVATSDFLSQTSNLAATTMYTPASDGWYRINASQAKTAGSGGCNGAFSWTDEAGNSQTAYIDQTRAIYVKGGNAITASATISGGTWNLHYVIEEL